MARDTELDRLKLVQDQAFERKQAAYQLQQSAWERRDAARVAMNRAYDAKQRAWDAQNEAWQYLQRVRDRNGPRIDSLNSLQETAFRNMQSAFGDASSAHERRDGASARAYADQGHAYKVESQGYVAERRNLVAEIRSAKDAHETLRPAFQQAKSAFDACKQAFNTAKVEHERAQAAFQQSKTEFDAASAAFKTRLEKVRVESRRRREDRKAIAIKAGVPMQYCDSVWISRDREGSRNIYFGGVGKPDGPGHGHYVLDRNDNVTYKRDPFDPHGAQNFTDNRRETAVQQIAQMAMNQWARTQVTPRMTQYEDADFKVTTRSGYDARHDCIVTDILIFDRQNKKEHYHLIIDEYGSELFSEWRDNH